MVSDSLTTAMTEPAVQAPRGGGLALSLQEAFTVAVRLRANRQVAANAEAFRQQMKQLLATADREARGAGYDGELVRLAVYAFVAFLDESVLNSSQAMFTGWSRQPLQEEIFGDHTAGETFFRNLDALMARQDSEQLADLLEVHLLCLLLGFRGRYGATDPAGLQPMIAGVRDRILRIRGGREPLSRLWPLPQGEVVQAPKDPWVRRLGIAAAAAAALTVALFLIFRLLLGSGVSELGGIVSRLIR
jgi:type VI secretion system protein ImpK